MVIEEKNAKSTATTVKVQYVFDIDINPTDFESNAVKQKIEEVQQQVKSVMEGAIVDSSKLSLNFTV